MGLDFYRSLKQGKLCTCSNMMLLASTVDVATIKSSLLATTVIAELVITRILTVIFRAPNTCQYRAAVTTHVTVS
jgi:hypothetical protein